MHLSPAALEDAIHLLDGRGKMVAAPDAGRAEQGKV